MTRDSENTLIDPTRAAPSVTMPATPAFEPVLGVRAEVAAPAARYVQLSLLGEGGMGKVHLCRDERIGREVAMKVILPEYEDKQSNRARFLREANVQGQLEHPSIVPVHDIGVTPEGSSYFTMKCVRGSTLARVLSDLGENVASTVERFTTRRLLAAFVNVCLAVDFAHSRGVVHRDLKPSNVMLGSFGEVYLLDWGIAKLSSETADVAEESLVSSSATPDTKTGAMIGTLAYMAPEQMAGEPATVRSDVFALGAILFEILTGRPLRPDEASLAELIRGPIDARCSVRAPERQIAPELEAICLRATSAAAGDRFPNARSLSDALETYLEGDRDVVRRREQAVEHVDRARAGLVNPEADASDALRELGAALALDPQNLEARAMVVQALTEAPKHVPAEVRVQLDRRVSEDIAFGVRKWPLMVAAWSSFAPLLYWAGMKQLAAVAFGACLLGVGTLLCYARVWRRGGNWLEYTAFVISALALVSASRGFGPFVIVPTMLATFSNSLQLHPIRRTRRVALGVCFAALIVAVIFSLLGGVPDVDGVSASALLLPGAPKGQDLRMTFVVLVMNLVTMVISATSAAEVRAQLTAAEERVLIQAWQVQRMMPGRITERPINGASTSSEPSV